MFEKDMDERMISFRQKGIIFGIKIFIILLVIKDILVDFSLLSFTGSQTIVDLIFLLIGTFSGMVYLIKQGAIQDSYLLKAWKSFILLAGFTMIWTLPNLFAKKPLMVENLVTMSFLKIILTVVVILFAIYMYLQKGRVEKELEKEE